MADCLPVSNMAQVMEKLVNAPDEVEIGVLRFVVVRRPKQEALASTLTVDGSSEGVVQGTILRTAIQDRGIELYKGVMAKMQQCGGVGQCSTCWVNVIDGMVSGVRLMRPVIFVGLAFDT